MVDFATGLSIAGEVFGGLGGKKKRGPDLDDQIDANIRLLKRTIYEELPAKMAAAKRAGVHPLVALGIPTSSGGGFSIGSDESNDTLSRIGEMGQNIGAALHRSQSPDERGFSAITAKQAVERGDLENELLKTQIAQIRASMVPAVYNGGGQMIAGQGQTGTATVLKEIFSGSKDGMEVGNPPGLATINYKGSKVRVPSKGMADANIEEGPAAWVVQLMNTVPDIAWAEKKSLNRALVRWVRNKTRYQGKSNW